MDGGWRPRGEGQGSAGGDIHPEATRTEESDLIAPLLLAAVLGPAKVPPKPPPLAPVSKEERAKQAAVKALRRVPHVAWHDDKLEFGDINYDRQPDAVALGL